MFHLFVFQGEPGEEVAIGSIEGVNGNGGKAKGEKVRRIQWFDGCLVRLGSKVWDRVLGPRHCVTLLYTGA